MIPQKLDLASITEGDTWEGIPGIIVTINGDFPKDVLQAVTMRFRRVDGHSPGPPVELSSSGSEIVIDSAVEWQISIPPQIVPDLTAGKWTWRLRFTDAIGVVSTYLTGEITVLPSV